MINQDSKHFSPQSYLVIGRQHSGNTMLAKIFGKHSQVYGQIAESTIFERKNEFKNFNKKEFILFFNQIKNQSKSKFINDNDGEIIYEKIKNMEKINFEEMFELTMYYFAKKMNKNYWAQKATSYIFYVDYILKNFPRTKIIYILRSPLDTSASMKVRHAKKKKNTMFSGIISWNKGLKKAIRHSKQYPDRFKIIKFEDLLSKPEDTLKTLMQWSNLNYEENLYNIPHINKAENPYFEDHSRLGLDKSKIDTYKKILSENEVKNIAGLIPDKYINLYYPDIYELKKKKNFFSFLYFLITGMNFILLRSFMGIVKNPNLQIRRIINRIGN